VILQAFVTWPLKRFLAHEICGGSSAASLIELEADGRGARGKPPFFSLAVVSCVPAVELIRICLQI
jgi:hypothetical protein